MDRARVIRAVARNLVHYPAAIARFGEHNSAIKNKEPTYIFGLKHTPIPEAAMCEKCTEIDEKVAHYRALAARLLDQLMLERIELLIADLLALKELLHPKQE